MTASWYFVICALWIQQDEQIFYGNFAPAPEEAHRGTTGVSFAFLVLAGIFALSGH